jgi:pyridoxine 5-phosphate synthase
LVELDAASRAALASSVNELKALGCRVSLFLDPVAEMMSIARDLGADRVELYTEPYAAAFVDGRASESTALYKKAAAAARAAGLGVNAGHDLNLHNLARFLHEVGPIDEVSIGHALIADALELGMAGAVRQYLQACASNRA